MASETYTLKHPIERAEGEPIRTLVIRRPRLRDIDAMNKAIRAAGGSFAEIAALAAATDAASGASAEPASMDPTAATAGGVAMLASMNGIEADILMDLDPDDFVELQERLAGFTKPGP